MKCLTRGQILEVVENAGGHDFGYEAQRTREGLLEEASGLEGELRRALEAAVLEKERRTRVMVS